MTNTMHRQALLALAVALLSSIALGQGASRADRGRTEALDPFTAADRIGELPSQVSLRYHLPPVGLQTMNDCAAWAFGYAGRTYMEAIDQGWRPDKPERIFSPTFIYNQVNGGVDQGSRVDEVLNLLRDKGAATLATVPYQANDYLYRIPAASFEEAEQFPIANYRVVSNGAQVRQALADGEIVITCVRTNPVFSSGRYDVYTPELHAEGQAQRRPGQPHGFHAMTIMGYDDVKGAFRFMNSWGRDWGDGGFVWVDYDVMESFNTSDMTERLADFCVVMIDREQPVVRQAGKYRAVAVDELAIDASLDRVGWDADRGAPRYHYRARLSGPPQQLANVEYVQWDFEIDGEAVRLTATQSAAGFAVFVSGKTPTLRSTATIKLQGRDKAEGLSAELEVPEVQPRAVELRRIDELHFSEATELQFQWTLLPELSALDWTALKSIEYRIENESGTDDEVVYAHPGGAKPKWVAGAAWAPTFISAAPREGTATFTFVDGGRLTLALDTTPFSPRAALERPLAISATWRPEGNDEGRAWYFYEVRLDFPLNLEPEIAGVVFSYYTATQLTEVQPELFIANGRAAYVHSGYAPRPFTAEALVFFERELPGIGSNFWVGTEVELGPDAAFVDASGMGIEYTEHYAGMLAGDHAWEVELFLDGTGSAGRYTDATWTIDGETFVIASEDSDGRRFPLKHVAIEPFEAQLLLFAIDGTTVELTRTITPHAAPNDALVADLTQRASEALTDTNTTLADLAVVGTPTRVAELAALDIIARLPWGATASTRVPGAGIGAPARSFNARIELPTDADALALLHFHDGSLVAQSVAPHGQRPEAQLPKLALEARERFVGHAGGIPAWHVELTLRGNAAWRDAVRTVEWSAAGADDERFPLIGEQAALTNELTTPEPLEVFANVTFDQATGLDPLHLRALVTTLSERKPDTLSIALTSDYKEPIPWNPNRDPFEDGDFGWLPFVARLSGSDAAFARVAKVEWGSAWKLEFYNETTDMYAVERVVDGVPGYPMRLGTSDEGLESECVVVARVTFVDGTTKELVRELDAEELGYWRDRMDVRVFDHGPLEDGRELLVSFRANAPDPERYLRHIDLALEGDARPAGSAPARALANPGFRRDFLTEGPLALASWTTAGLAEWGSGFLRYDEEVRRMPAWTLTTPAPVKPAVLIGDDPLGIPRVHFVQLELPTGVLGRVERVEYDVVQGERTRTLQPLLPVGELSLGDAFGRFDLRLIGARPDRVRARLYAANAAAPFLELDTETN